MGRSSLIAAITISEGEWSSSGDSKTEDEDPQRRSPREKDGRDKDKEDCEHLYQKNFDLGFYFSPCQRYRFGSLPPSFLILFFFKYFKCAPVVHLRSQTLQIHRNNYAFLSVIDQFFHNSCTFHNMYKKRVNEDFSNKI